jgi:hypothetical protein
MNFSTHAFMSSHANQIDNTETDSRTLSTNAYNKRFDNQTIPMFSNVLLAPSPMACSPYVTLNTTERRWIRKYLAEPEIRFSFRPLAQAAALAKLAVIPDRFVTVPEWHVLRAEMKSWSIEFSEVNKMQHFAARRPDLTWGHWRYVQHLGVDEFQEKYVRTCHNFGHDLIALPQTPMEVDPQSEATIEELLAQLDVQTSPREIFKDRKELVRGKRLKTLPQDLKNHVKLCGNHHKFANCPYNAHDSRLLFCSVCKSSVTFVVAPKNVCLKCATKQTQKWIRKAARAEKVDPQGFNIFPAATTDLMNEVLVKFSMMADIFSEKTTGPLAASQSAAYNVSNAAVKLSTGVQPIRSAADRISRAATKVDALTTKLHSMLPESPNKWMQVGAQAIIWLFQMATAPIANKAAATLSFLCSSGIGFSLASSFVSNFSSCITDTFQFLSSYLTLGSQDTETDAQPVEPQGPDGIASILTAAVGLLGVGVFKVVSTKQDIDTWLRRMDLIPKALKGFGDITDIVMKAVKASVSFFLVKLGCEDPFAKDPDLFEKFVTDTQNVLSRPQTTETYNAAYAAEVRQLYIDGLRLLQLCSTMRNNEVSRLIMSYFQQIATLNQKLTHLGFTTSTRQEPFILYIHGGTSVGKSTATMPLLIEMMRRDPEEDATKFADNIHCRQAENEYWDNVKNSVKYLVYDDFGQMRDSAAVPNPEFWEIIRLSNNMPFAPHMADLTDKGKVFLEPKMILCSSNTAPENLHVQSLTFPSALLRRFDLEFEVRLKHTYSTVRHINGVPHSVLDTTKVRGRPDFDVYEFWGADGSIYEWADFCDLVWDKYTQKRNLSNNFNANLAGFAKDPEYLNALTRLATGGAPTAFNPAVPPPLLTTADPDFVAAMQRLASRPKTVRSAPVAPVAAAPNPFDDDLNPFADDEDEDTAVPAQTDNSSLSDYNPLTDNNVDPSVAASQLAFVNALFAPQPVTPEGGFVSKSKSSASVIPHEKITVADEDPSVWYDACVPESECPTISLLREVRISITERTSTRPVDFTERIKSADLSCAAAFCSCRSDNKLLSHLFWLNKISTRTRTQHADDSDRFASLVLQEKFPGYVSQELRSACKELLEASANLSFAHNLLSYGGSTPTWYYALLTEFSQRYYDDFVGEISAYLYFPNFLINPTYLASTCAVSDITTTASDFLISVSSQEDFRRLLLSLRLPDAVPKAIWLKFILAHDIDLAQLRAHLPALKFPSQEGESPWAQAKSTYVHFLLKKYAKIGESPGFWKRIFLMILGNGVVGFAIGFAVTGIITMLFKLFGYFLFPAASAVPIVSVASRKAKKIVLESTKNPKNLARSVRLEDESPESAKTPKAKIPHIRVEAADATEESSKAPRRAPAVVRVEVDENTDLSKVTKAVLVETEGQSDPNAWDIVSCRLLGNMVTLKNQQDQTVCAGLMLGGKVLLTYRHTVESMTFGPDEKLFLSTYKADPLCEFSPAEMQISACETSEGEIDLVLIDLPRNVPRFKNVASHFIDVADFAKLNEHAGALATIRRLPGKERKSLLTLMQVPALFTREITAPCYKTTNKVMASIGYAAETKAGDCGGILIALNPKFEKKICGMHVAGSTGVGYAVPLNQSRIEKWLQAANLNLFDAPPLEQVYDSEIVVPEGAFLPMGRHQYVSSGGSATGISPSSISGCIQDPITGPAILRPFVNEDGVEVDPLQAGLLKCAGVNPLIPSEQLAMVSADVARVYIYPEIDSPRKIYSLDEACFGELGNSFYGPLTLTSSPGFPFCKLKASRKPGKRTWIDNEEFVISDELRNLISANLEKLKLGQRIEVYWQDLLKDERRPLAKVAAGKTRVFSASPLDFTLLCRMYFGAFVAHQARNRVSNESSIGINPYSIDWQNLATHLRTKGPKVFAGDYSGWDGSVSAQLLWSALDVIEEWYDGTEEERLIRATLFLDIVSSVHIFGDTVYGQTHCMPSGVYLTATVNTVIGQMLMRLFWLRCAPANCANMESFNEHVALAIYGDDNVVNVSDFASTFFNQHSVTEAAPFYGAVYTDEAKTGNETAKTRKITEVTFLKRSFTWSPTDLRYLGQLDLSVIDEMCNWYHHSDLERKQLPLVIDSQMREYAMYTRELYDSRLRTIQRACRAASIRLPAYPDFTSNRQMLLTGFRTNLWA